MTCGRKFYEVTDFANWFCNQPHKHKILVAGNHDRLMESHLSQCIKEFHDIAYLQDSKCQIDGIRFYGSPWQPWFYDWAFNAQRGPEIKKYWDRIPQDTDVLVTHGPPKGHGDLTAYRYGNERVGCEELSIAVQVIRPKVHIFGHIHNGYGIEKTPNTAFHNVSICDEEYIRANEPQVIEL